MNKLLIIIFLFILCNPILAKTLITYDLTYLQRVDRSQSAGSKEIWDTLHFTSALQGIVNRNEPKLYTFFVGENNEDGSVDKFWLSKMTEKNEWLSDYEIKEVSSVENLVEHFKKDIKGLVVYDENVPATSNVASTIAGVENLLPIRFDKDANSLYTFLTKTKKIPVKKWLLNKNGTSIFTGKGIIPDTNIKSTSSAKCDAYIWAKVKYLDTGICNPEIMGYYIDSFWIDASWGRISNNTLANHDYIISKKGFFFDLSPWEDEVPCDDRNQVLATDFNTLKEILLSAYTQTEGEKAISISGFVPWDKKYSSFTPYNGSHEVVESEWKYAETISNYNAFMDADAINFSGMANGSVFCNFPLEEKYIQPKPTINDLIYKNYIGMSSGAMWSNTFICFYAGDYDAASWTYQALPALWRDPERGNTPMSWAINPNLGARFAFGLHYYRKTATSNDFFIAGDSGAGYLNPGHLYTPRKISNLPSGIDTWKEHCKKWYEKFDLTLTGFLLEGNAPQINDELLDAYSVFSPDGIGTMSLNEGLYKDMPYVRIDFDTIQFDKTRIDSYVKSIAKDMGKTDVEFLMYRHILWSPSEQIEFIEKLKKESPVDFKVVDPYTFMLLIKFFHEMKYEKMELPSKNKFNYKNIEIISHSSLFVNNDIRDMFEGKFGTHEYGKLLFKDEKPTDNIYFVEWKLLNPSKIKNLSIELYGDFGTMEREINSFKLFARNSDLESWELMGTLEPSHPSAGFFEVEVLNKDKKYEFFRAEFTPLPTVMSYAPRIGEIETF